MKTLADYSALYSGSLALERLLSRKTMSLLRMLFFWAMALSFITGCIALVFLPKEYFGITLLGIAAITGGLWLEQILLFSYHNSFYFRGLSSIIGIDHEETGSGVTYEVAKIILQSPDDMTRAFCTSTLGSVILIRTGLSFSALDTCLSTSRTPLRATDVVVADGELFTLITLGLYLVAHDPAFKNLLKNNGIKEETFIASLRWVIDGYHQEKRVLRWWSKDQLSKRRGIGLEWTYGTAFLLERYSRPITTTAVFSMLTSNAAYAEEKITEIETVLARSHSANALIVGDPGVGKIDLVMAIKQRIESGIALDAIAGKHIIALDTTRLFANRQKGDLESLLLSLFSEAAHSGNMVIVMENISTVIREAQALGVFLPELMDEFLASPTLQFIVTDTPGAYHTALEPLGGFTRRFAEVLIEAPSIETTIRILQAVVPHNEYINQCLFTYGALEAIATSADHYLVEGDMPDKAITLLTQVAAEARHAKKEIIDADFVYTLVSAVTGIPAGPITDNERDLLLHLEERLHTRVIGQERALGAVARTMRRARVGIQSSEKPIGSFLFLGPTGVGKTETAKALAYIFFGSETAMLRLDMSEYSGSDALPRLLGDETVSGALPDLLREHPYAVLLLDEFEKANRAVHDLFLQILDEGIFTDGRGEKVNARNTIIIATSNAGSQLIMRTVEQRKALAHLSEEIVSHIISEGYFRPELINRFDSTIIFEPLTSVEQGRVASLLLGGLTERVKDRGYELTVTKDLLDALVAKGYSPEFGARPMLRVLQDVVEEKIAQKIIAGEVKRGDTITLERSDISDAELAV